MKKPFDISEVFMVKFNNEWIFGSIKKYIDNNKNIFVFGNLKYHKNIILYARASNEFELKTIFANLIKLNFKYCLHMEFETTIDVPDIPIYLN